MPPMPWAAVPKSWRRVTRCWLRKKSSNMTIGSRRVCSRSLAGERFIEVQEDQADGSHRGVIREGQRLRTRRLTDFHHLCRGFCIGLIDGALLFKCLPNQDTITLRWRTSEHATKNKGE